MEAFDQKCRTCDDCQILFHTVGELASHWERTHSLAAMEQEQKMRTCGVCRLTFSDVEARLDHHERQHVQRFWCDLCPTGFVHRQALKKHQNARHGQEWEAAKPPLELCFTPDIGKTTASGATVYPCQSCKKEFRALKSLRLHAKRCVFVHCWICQETFVNRRLAKDHYIEKHPGMVADSDEEPVDQDFNNRSSGEDDSETPLASQLAVFSFDEEDPENQRTTMSDQAEDECCWSDAVMPDQLHSEASDENEVVMEQNFTEDDEELDSHPPAIDDVEEEYRCRVCDRLFHSDWALRQHLCPKWDQEILSVLTGDSAAVERPFQCEQCGRPFRRACDLQKHQKGHEKEFDHPCPCCGLPFSDAPALEQHRQEAHPESVDKPFVCRCCPATFRTKHEWQSHERLHSGERPFACPQCAESFRLSGQLQKHLDKEHMVEQPWKCPFCGEVFVRKKHLNQHHRRRHPGQKRYTCGVCGQTCATPGALKIHQFTHTGEKPYPCDLCDKAFANVSNLKKHQRTHTGEKPYPCDQCDKAFSQSGHLKYHQLTHTGEKPYPCDQCDKAFSKKKILTKHQRTHQK